MDAEELIKLARQAIKSRKVKKAGMKEKRGVFVTLYSFPNKKLRACIGFVEPVFPLWEGVQRAAIAAAYNDPRFKPLAKEEVDKIIVEISILSLLKESKVEGIRKGDGVVLEFKNYKGVFLPQVWDELPGKKNFLDALCLKAGLPSNCWKKGGVKFYKFYVSAFEETSPSGSVIKIK